MLTKTHLAISVFAILFFISLVENKLIFVGVVLVATLLPDIDSRFSGLGSKLVFRPLQFFLKHRGIFHSFTFVILLTLLFVFFVPILAFGFFLGYGLHLLADSFTIDGIQPFYPLKKKVSGKIRVGGKTEIGVLVIFVLLNLFFVIWKIGGLF